MKCEMSYSKKVHKFQPRGAKQIACSYFWTSGAIKPEFCLFSGYVKNHKLKTYHSHKVVGVDSISVMLACKVSHSEKMISSFLVDRKTV